MRVHSRSQREYLHDLVSAKNQAFRPLTEEENALGFLGWRERGYLPHCDYPGLVQLVTFRLADSMPASRRGEWEHLLSIEDNQEKRTKLEAYLDEGVGTCLLRYQRAAQIVEAAVLYEHGVTHDVLAWCVMPNHAHVGARLAQAAGQVAAKLEILLGWGNQRLPETLGAVVGTRVLGHVHAG